MKAASLLWVSFTTARDIEFNLFKMQQYKKKFIIVVGLDISTMHSHLTSISLYSQQPVSGSQQAD